MLRKWLGDSHFGRVHRFDIVSIFLKLKDLSPTRILDAGCGNGEFLLRLKQIYPKAEIAGIDLTLPTILPPKQVRLGQYNLEYPLPNEWRGRDLIVSIEVLQCCKDDLAYLRSLRQAALPGGKLVLHVMTAAGLSYDHSFGFRKFLRHDPEASPFRSGQFRSGYSASELAKLLDLSGWKLQMQAYTFGRQVMLAHTLFEVYRQWRVVPYFLTPLLRIAAKPLALRGEADGAAILIYAEAV